MAKAVQRRYYTPNEVALHNAKEVRLRPRENFTKYAAPGGR